MTDIAANIARLNFRLEPLLPADRPLRIVAVSKRKSVAEMRMAVAAGLKDLGENRIQEAVEKFSEDAFPGVERHFIAPIQSNKLKRMLEYFHWFHGLENLHVAEAIDRSGSSVKCLLEVNTGNEESKHGLAPGEVPAFAEGLRRFRNLQVLGLMTLAPFTRDSDRIRTCFRTLATLSRELKKYETENIRFRELSMGMSNDYLIAVEEGATILRIGTDIFGERQ